MGVADCLFCRIAEKQVPAAIVHETESTLAFRDIHPRAPVHVLVIPKKHIENVMQIALDQGALVAEIHRTIQAVARAENVNETGFRIVVNNGSDSGQEVKHLHYHVLAGRRLAWPPG